MSPFPTDNPDVQAEFAPPPTHAQLLEDTDDAAEMLRLLVAFAAKAVADIPQPNVNHDANRWVGIARTHFQEGLMAMRRALHNGGAKF